MSEEQNEVIERAQALIDSLRNNLIQAQDRNINLEADNMILRKRLEAATQPDLTDGD